MATGSTVEPLWTKVDPFELGRLREDIRLNRFIETIAAHLRDARDADSALRFVVRACRDYFGGENAATGTGAAAACLAIMVPPGDVAELLFAVPQEHVWDLRLFASALRGEKPPVQPNLMFARIRRRDRAWAVLALRRASGEFDRAERQALVRIGSAVSALMREIDQQRIREVRDRIDRKIMSELRPIDLSYQILDALRSLTGYDHSSAVLMSDETGGSLQIVAEQIAWRKGKSDRVGSVLALSPDVVQLLSDDVVFGFTRSSDDRWEEWEGKPVDKLIDLIRLDRDNDDSGLTRESQVLFAPLRGRDGVLGALREYARFIPGRLAATRLTCSAPFCRRRRSLCKTHNAPRALETKMIAAERKHAMAELARGVSHDLNNALGAVLPLVQQLRAEAAESRMDPATCIKDLEHIEQSLQVCRRIFNGMLTFARRSTSAIGQGHVRQAVDCTLAILGDNLRRRSIEPSVDLPDYLPTVATAQNDLEQLLLNLLTNARDAMLDGGELRVFAHADSGADTLQLHVEDTGAGIAPEHLPLVLEPFFTTKPNGSGLGLSICRSIVWEIGGQLSFQSTVGKGTRATLTLPVVAREG